MNTEEAKRILEAALLSSAEPLPVSLMTGLFEDMLSADTLRELLVELRHEWQGKAVELVCVATGWRFQTHARFQPYIERLQAEKAPRYSRAVLETLAIVAHKQPVTRGDIEEIRGVGVSSQIIKTLEDRGWIEVIGHREGPGRPGLLATTQQFLNDFGLSTLSDLPPLPEAAPALQTELELPTLAPNVEPASNLQVFEVAPEATSNLENTETADAEVSDENIADLAQSTSQASESDEPRFETEEAQAS